MAFDSLSVVVNAKNSFVDCLTVAELKKIWEPAAEGRVTRWSDVRPGFPAQGFRLVGPGSASGTFDYFTLAVVGEQGRSRGDYTKSDDDTALAEAVMRDPSALGYFGYALYQAHSNRLKVVAIDGGEGCVAPSVATVAEESYRPLARPVFLYASTQAVARPEVAAFARFALSSDHTIVIQAAGYIPLPVVASLVAAKHLASNRTGSIFGGRGAVLGVAAETFTDEERVKNALVR
jgi:phosphate transport system substrate-binding protein